MQPRIRWWERRWLASTLGVFGGLFSLVSSCVGYDEAVDRASRSGNRLTYVVFAPSGDLVYGLVQQDLFGEKSTQLVAWDTKTGRQLWAAPAPSDYLGLYVCRGGLLIVSYDNLRLLASTTGKVRWQRKSDTPNIYRVEFSPDSRRFYIQDTQGIQVRVTETGKTVAHLNDTGSSFDVLPDGNLALLETRGKERLLVKVDPTTQKTIGLLARDMDRWEFSPDHELLAVRRSGVWLFATDVRTGKFVNQTNLSQYASVSFLDNQRMILGGPLGTVWNPRANKSRPANPEEGNPNLWYSPDRRLILVPEYTGRKGRRLPIATLQDRQTKRAGCTLEGQTGW